MLNKILSILGVSSMMSGDMIKKGLEKVDPRMKKFFTESNKYGFPLGATLGFLKSELGGEPEVNRQLRPDEAANIETKRQQETPGRLASTVGNVAAGGALGGLGGAAISGLSKAFSPEQMQEQPMAAPQAQPPQAPPQQPAQKKPLRQQLSEAHEQEYGSGSSKNRLVQLTQEGLAMLQRLNQGQ